VRAPVHMSRKVTLALRASGEPLATMNLRRSW
jgi:hypothetical protein